MGILIRIKNFLKSDNFLLSFSISIGITFILFVFQVIFDEKIDTNSFSFKFTFLAFSGAFFSTLPIVILFRSKHELFKKLSKLDNIESKLYTEIDKNIKALDTYSFSNDRFTIYKEIIKRIHNSNDEDYNIFEKQLNILLKYWKEKGTKKETDLTQILYHLIINDLQNFEVKNSYIIPLETYLNLLLHIIELGFSINKTFYFFSYTNALPDSWFISNSSLEDYRNKFADILSKYKADSNNILKRFVLTYKDDIKKNNISSASDFKAKWKGLNSDQQNAYINDFMLNNENYKIEMDDSFNFKDGFTELIYFGGENDGQVKWKWAIKGEYIESSRSMFFYLHNFSKIEKDIEIGSIKSPNEDYKIVDKINHFTASTKINVNIARFPDIIDKDQYSINTRSIFQTTKIELGDDDNNGTAK